ncbi:MAG: RIP metalloprotease RseP [Proteobacteria bacterium]|nr:RIP metalloprotease RseP [Pseudomonadota bacterium]
MNAVSALGGWGQTFVWTIIPFLFVLTIVVFFHELGHFWVARRNGVRVEMFSIGFGRELIGFNDRHGTRWKLCAIPLGGYVKFFGDADAASTPDFETAASMSAAERSESFFHKTLGQRAAIVAAGPIANFILAIVIFAGIFMLSGKMILQPRVSNLVVSAQVDEGGFRRNDVILSVDGQPMTSLDDVRRAIEAKSGQPLEFALARGMQQVKVQSAANSAWFRSSVAEQAGFRPGDLVLSIDGRAIESFSDMQRIVGASAGQALAIKVERDGRQVDLTVTPAIFEFKDRFGGTHRIGRIGISKSNEPGDTQFRRYDPLTATWMGVKETWFVIDRTFAYLGGVIMGTQSADQLGGPIRIAQVSGEAAQIGFVALLSLAALISVSIGLLNLFPIPMLDGGHLVFYAIEAIRGRPMSEQAQEVAFRFGLALVLMLMIFATWNDIRGLVG